MILSLTACVSNAPRGESDKDLSATESADDLDESKNEASESSIESEEESISITESENELPLIPVQEAIRF